MSKILFWIAVLCLSVGMALTGCSNKSSGTADTAPSHPPGATIQAQIAQIQQDRNIPPQAKPAMIQTLKAERGTASH